MPETADYDPVEDLTGHPTTVYDPDGTIVARLNYTTGELYDDLLTDAGFPPIYAAETTPIPEGLRHGLFWRHDDILQALHEIANG